MVVTHLLRYYGDMSGRGQIVGGYEIGDMKDGAVVDMSGVRIGSYRRITLNGPNSLQEIEVTLFEE